MLLICLFLLNLVVEFKIQLLWKPLLKQELIIIRRHLFLVVAGAPSI